MDHLRRRAVRRLDPVAPVPPRIQAPARAASPAFPRPGRLRRSRARAVRPGRCPGRAAARITGPGNDQPPLHTGSTMLREEHRSPAVIARSACRNWWPALAGAPGSPVAGTAARGHRTVAGLPQRRRGLPGRRPGDGSVQQETKRLLRRTVAARRKLADVEEALGRLPAGTFGSCEQCGSAIPASLLAVIPETRYCPRCDTGSAPARSPGRSPGTEGRNDRKDGTWRAAAPGMVQYGVGPG